MKHLFLLLLFPAFAAAQTYQLEVDYINALLATKEKLPEELVSMKRQLDEITDTGKDYPVLPYDTLTESFNFTYILDCPGVPEKVVFKRLKQWCSLRYVDVDIVLRHEDTETGKLITKGYAPISYTKKWEGWWGRKRTLNQTNKCYHTLIFTCKEGKIKMEAQGLRYSFVTGGYYSFYTSSYTERRETEIYLNSMFPIVQNDKREWQGLLALARETTNVYSRHAKDLKQYILNWQDDYKF